MDGLSNGWRNFLVRDFGARQIRAGLVSEEVPHGDPATVPDAAEGQEVRFVDKSPPAPATTYLTGRKRRAKFSPQPVTQPVAKATTRQLASSVMAS